MGDPQFRKDLFLRCLVVALLCACIVITLLPGKFYDLFVYGAFDAQTATASGRVIVAFAELPQEVKSQAVEEGTALEELNLPDTLVAVCQPLGAEGAAGGSESTETEGDDPGLGTETTEAEAPEPETEGSEPPGVKPEDTEPGTETPEPGTEAPGPGTETPGPEIPGTEAPEPGTETPGPEFDPSLPEGETPPASAPGDGNAPAEAPSAGDSSADDASAEVFEQDGLVEETTTVTLQKNLAPLAKELSLKEVRLQEKPALGAADGAPGAQGEPASTQGDAVNPQGEELVIGGVAWGSVPAYDGGKAGAYRFAPILPEGYALGEGVSLPEITVTVKGAPDELTGKSPLKKRRLAVRLSEEEAADSTERIVISENTAWDKKTLQDVTLAVMPGIVLTIQEKVEVLGTVVMEGGGTVLRGNEIANIEVGVGASLTVKDMTLDGNGVSTQYAMIDVLRQGAITLEGGCRISNCVKSVGYGAALYVPEGTAVLNGPTIENCSSSEFGGAICIQGGEMTIRGGVYRNNRTTGQTEDGGGFLSNSNASVTILGGEFLSNSSTGKGGCIYHSGDKTTVTDIQGGVFSGNTSSCQGFEGSGAIWNSAKGTGDTKLIFSGDVQLCGGSAPGTDGIYLDQQNGVPRRIYISDTLSYPVTMYLEAIEGYEIAEGYGGYILLHERDMKKIFFVDVGNSGEEWYAELNESHNCAVITTNDPKYQFVVRYIKNGAVGTSVKDERVYAAEEKATVLDAGDLTKKGCKFMGWDTKKDGTGKRYQPGETITMTDDVDLYAIFEEGYLSGTFYSGGEDAKSIQKKTEVGKVTDGVAGIAAPEMEPVDGWKAAYYTAQTSGYEKSVEAGGTAEVSEDSVFYGVYTRDVTVTYDAQGGDTNPIAQKGTRHAVSREEMDYEDPTFTLADGPGRTGYQFMGWEEQDQAGERVKLHEAGGKAAFSQDVTLYAVWEAGDATYTVEHYWQNLTGDGYVKHEAERFPGIAGEAVEAKPKRYDGFAWNRNGTVTGTVLADHSLTLKLYYDRDLYQIEFDLNGASGTPPEPQTVRFGGGLFVNDPKWRGYSFWGWYKDQGCAKGQEWNFETTVEHNITSDSKEAKLYAKWVDDIAPVWGNVSFNEGYRNVLDWIIRKKSLIVTIPVTEEGSGVKAAEYTLMEEAGEESVTPDALSREGLPAAKKAEVEAQDGETVVKITLEEDFKGRIRVFCTDNAGNVSLEKSVTAENGGVIVEDNAPEITFLAKEGDFDEAFLEQATVDVSVRDAIQGQISGGIAEIAYRVDAGEKKTVSDASFAEGIVESHTFSVKIAEPGEHILSVTATDNAGNRSEASQRVLIGMPRTYHVEHYFQNLEGNGYVKEIVEKVPCNAGDEVSAKAKEYKGFSENLSHEGRDAFGVVPEEGLLTLRLYYDRDVYEVRFDSNGAGVTPPEPQKARYEGFLEKPLPPERAGYSFVDWRLDEEGTEGSQWDFEQSVDRNTDQKITTLYAHWVDDIAPTLGAASFNEGYKNIFQWIVRKKSLIVSVPIVEEGSGVKQASYLLLSDLQTGAKAAPVSMDGPDQAESEAKTAALTLQERGAVAKFAIDADFTGKIVLFCEDNAGNVSVRKSLTAEEGGVIVEDNAPEIDFSTEDGDLLDWFTGNVTIDVSVRDDVGSGISGGLASVSYRVDGGKERNAPDADFKEGMITFHAFSVDLSGAGTHEVAVIAVDNAGNRSEELVQIRIQKKKKKKSKLDPAAPNAPEPTGAPLVTPTEPKTGEEARMRLWVSIAMAAALLYFMLYFASGYEMTREEMKRRLAALLRWTKEGGRLRRPAAIAAIFGLLLFYYSFGVREAVEQKET